MFPNLLDVKLYICLEKMQLTKQESFKKALTMPSKWTCSLDMEAAGTIEDGLELF